MQYRNKAIQHSVYNNIFAQVGSGTVAARGIFTDGSMRCDGNLFFRMDTKSTAPIFDGVDNATDYSSLAAFQAATGFERRGVYADPVLNSIYAPADAPDVWGGVDIASMTKWPVVDPGFIYKGAVRPGTQPQPDAGSSPDGGAIGEAGSPDGGAIGEAGSPDGGAGAAPSGGAGCSCSIKERRTESAGALLFAAALVVRRLRHRASPRKAHFRSPREFVRLPFRDEN